MPYCSTSELQSEEHRCQRAAFAEKDLLSRGASYKNKEEDALYNGGLVPKQCQC